MFIRALFIIVKKYKQLKWPSIDEWINKRWFICTMEYYSAIKRNEVLIHATIWMNPENILLSETSQSQRTAYCLSLYELDRTGKSIIATESRLGVA